MHITLTEKQYRCLIKTMDAGSGIYETLGDEVSEEYEKQSAEIGELNDYLLTFAPAFGAGDMVEDFMGSIIINDQLSEEWLEAEDEYENNVFWNELEMRLGQRDYERTITKADKKETAEHPGRYSNRIDEIYKAWGKEFKENGIERLGIIEK
ncbi:MAG: hypothetical protein G01um101418_83 [Parcubacteria group bacterium Gr01-1014_18]|nr:MAG: hypothetical protein Greene041636_83 [Parcubacteria group bacterium Greene0416_36]TSC81589.1 MAG: hypothetical protein G01um101418_83 [Parcubacteria group bacterium Gr01-1014_18]TSC99599.1 MAG: hypothetical protein Greene101420_3 [Parcubacteria group bacterium Greene1014_20]TSD06006.1 MAG: hypothetical protein Greene07142_970 [Parcubacteria group bacterium Greene0714_2]